MKSILTVLATLVSSSALSAPVPELTCQVTDPCGHQRSAFGKCVVDEAGNPEYLGLLAIHGYGFPIVCGMTVPARVRY